ncbi:MULTISPECIES: acyltransferase family protein [unclassified Marinobacterium]|uniref:acyltransferase family protein n=1 Tax=unclassified Marinobacterium TaxID=2644139 RepID=UPI001568017C|nr:MULTISPECIES: acyltransferase family protein [unclassified Marinobacterium]
MLNFSFAKREGVDMGFRGDINGLRAIAVMGVVLFHFKESLLPGGFAGVDVFFVISGFLMTSIIFRGLERGDFSTLNFYMARANRIVPALAVLCLAMLILGYFFLLSMDYKTLGRDVATSMFFVSNIMFSMRKGYFEFGDNFLLHTWSLSAEWQFYLIYPLVLVVLSRLMSLRWLKKTLVALCFLGFLFGVYASIKWPGASYFLLGARAWEMLLGGLAFLYPLSLSKNRKRYTEIVGLFLVLGSYLMISGKDLWPGYLSLLPTIGAVMVIAACRNGGSVLASKVLQKLGLWSYSIYLWHWPVAVSFSYYDIPQRFIPFGILLSVVLGYLSYCLIETRRFKFEFSLKPVAGYASMLVIFGAVGAYIFQTQGISSRNELASNSLIQGGTDDDFLIHEGLSLLNTDADYEYLLLGDSNANHYVRGIRASGAKVKLSWWGSCLSYPDVVNKIEGFFPNWKETCHSNHRLGAQESRVVILAQSYKKPENDQFECLQGECGLSGNYLVDLEMLTHRLIRNYDTKTKLAIIGELPKPKNADLMRCLRTAALLALEPNCDVETDVLEIVSRVNSVLSRVAAEYENVIFVDPAPVMCTATECDYTVDGKSIFFTDGEHLSGFGSELVWDYVMERVNHFSNVDVVRADPLEAQHQNDTDSRS